MQVPERYRWKNPGAGYESSEADGNNGVFAIPNPVRGRATMKVIASDGMGWDHVSVSLPDRCPTWEEMCYVKSLFWSDDECVIQYHPPKDKHINCHPYCLHLWKPNVPIPMPPSIMVGYKQKR